MSFGNLIVFEGIDGAGTTTQVALVAKLLEDNGIPIYITAEPSQGSIGKFLREALRDHSLDPHTDTLLFAADRVEHTWKEILPRIWDNDTVLSDRYLLSTVCYQSAANRVDPEWIFTVNKKAIEPDLTIILDCDPRISLPRTKDRAHAEKFETIEFLDEVRANYKKYLDPPKVVEVDASGTIEETFALVIPHIEEVLGCDLER